MVPFALFGVADPNGVLWDPGVGWSFRFIHPFLFISLALGLLLGLWAANAPYVVPQSTKRTRVMARLRIRALEIRSIVLAVVVIGGLTAVGIVASGLRGPHSFSLTSAIAQTAVWCVWGILGAVIGVFLLRRGFRAIAEVAFAFQCGDPVSGWEDLLDELDWTDPCPGRARANMAASAGNDAGTATSLIPAALCLLDDGQAVFADGTLRVTTPFRGRDLSRTVALIERTALSEGYPPPTITERDGQWTVSVLLQKVGDGARLSKLLCGPANPRDGHRPSSNRRFRATQDRADYPP